MSRQTRTSYALLMVLLVALTGCQPTQPFYLTGRPGDLSHYLNEATNLDDPDLDVEPSPEAEGSLAPLTISDPAPQEMWDLTLEDAISTAMQNSKFIRRAFHVSTNLGPFSSTSGNSFTAGFIPFTDGSTIYDPAVLETDPQSGVEAALSAFDAQLSASLFWDKTDRPQNVGVGLFAAAVTQSDVANFQAQMSKRSATGSQWFFRNTVVYDNGNQGGLTRALTSIYTAALEAEWRQPLLRGRGTAVNRVPIVLARIRTDVGLAELEANVRNMLKDTEDTYWNLMLQYRVLEAAKVGRDSALDAWRQQFNLYGKGGQLATIQDVAQAREQYFAFRAEVETALRDLYNLENNLRFMMGLTATDGRLIRPITEPTTAAVTFDWQEINAEALVRWPELRRQKWAIKARETELIASKNQLLPQLNATALYRWLGVGDKLMAADRDGVNFPGAGSRAFEELTEGQFQEVRWGVEFAMPVGYRRELAGVRNTQLLIARERARLEDSELQVTHLLATAVRGSDGWYQLMQTQFNRLVAAREEERARLAIVLTGAGIGATPLNLLLDSQRRVARAQADYYRAVIEYNKSISEIHFRKGSLLEFDGVQMAEGPWPQKAYFDALGRARQRSASMYMNYGWTRPGVVSQGPIEQSSGVGSTASPGRESYTQPPEEIPSGQPTPAERRSADPRPEEILRPTADPAAENSPSSSRRQSVVKESAVTKDNDESDESIVWEESGVDVAVTSAPTPAVVKPVKHEEKSAPASISQPSTIGWKKMKK